MLKLWFLSIFINLAVSNEASQIRYRSICKSAEKILSQNPKLAVTNAEKFPFNIVTSPGRYRGILKKWEVIDQMTLPQYKEFLERSRGPRSADEIYFQAKLHHKGRFVARIIPAEFKGTFQKSGRPFAFVADPEDLVGDPRTVLEKAGYPQDWIDQMQGEEVVVVVIDTEKVNWLEKEATWEEVSNYSHDERFQETLESLAPEVYQSKSFKKNLKARMRQSQREKSRRLKRPVKDSLEQSFGVNSLFEGKGYTRTKNGDVGAREYLVADPDKTFKLTPDNHFVIELGKI